MVEIRTEEILEKIKNKVLKEVERNKDGIPYMSNRGSYDNKTLDNIAWWTNGFFAGSLWQLYAYYNQEEFKTQAGHIEKMLDRALDEFYGIHHDVGFMWLHTAVAHFKLTGDETSRLRGIKAATSLAARFNINGNYIRSWNRNLPGWSIIDSMMNLPILFWASEESEDPRFKAIALAHADTLQKYLIRPDGSSGHIASFDPESGEFLELIAGQGHSPDSSWTRGQAWALYGFTLAYKHSKDANYLETAKRSANYFLSNVSITNFIPRIDFRAPEANLDTDTSAGLIAASGMLELSQYVSDEEKDLYIEGSKKIVSATIANHCNFDESIDGIVYGGAADYHKEDQKDVNLIYADYFLIEYLLKLENKALDLW